MRSFFTPLSSEGLSERGGGIGVIMVPVAETWGALTTPDWSGVSIGVSSESLSIIGWFLLSIQYLLFKLIYMIQAKPQKRKHNNTSR